jgi:hypothetical protein
MHTAQQVVQIVTTAVPNPAVARQPHTIEGLTLCFSNLRNSNNSQENV